MYKVRQAVRKHRKLLSVCAMVLTIALMFWAVNSPAIVGVSAAKRVLPIYSVQRDDRVVSLSFDAAWGNEDTQMLIDILNKYNRPRDVLRRGRMGGQISRVGQSACGRRQ